MAFVFCMVPVAPMRKEAAHRSEMVSQLLFGEIAEVITAQKDFTQIRCLYDGYEGWCQSTQLLAIDTGTAAINRELLTDAWCSTIDLNGQKMQIPLGSSMGLLQNGEITIGNYHISYGEALSDPASNPCTADAIAARAMRYLNTAYLWGGRSVFGIDCSGFVQQVFRFFQIALPRDAYQQATVGEPVGFLQETKCGDLAFFDNEEGRITHVGLLLTPDTIIHSSGKVRIDKIDNMGILSSDTGQRTHRLRMIRNYW